MDLDPTKNLEMSQETLGAAMHSLAEALVLKGKEMRPLIVEQPPSEGAGTPYQISQELPRRVAVETLLDEDDVPQAAEALYIMEHRLDDDPAFPETYEAVVVSWSHMLGKSDVRSNRSIMINRVRSLEGEHYLAETSVEFARFYDGKWHRENFSGRDYSEIKAFEEGSDEWLEVLKMAADDLEVTIGEVDLDDIERIYKVAEHIRNQDG